MADIGGQAPRPVLVSLFSVLSALSAFSVIPAVADTCSSASEPGIIDDSAHVEYQSRAHAEGHEFSIGETQWRLNELALWAGPGDEELAVMVPSMTHASSLSAMGDFFLTVHTMDSDEAHCSDVAFGSDIPHHRLKITDSSSVDVHTASLGAEHRHIESTRVYGTQLLLRIEGRELLISTGFSTQQQFSVEGCTYNPEDSFGYTELEPGHIVVTCVSADNQSRYMANVDWKIDYQWPENRRELIDELIDYVRVTAGNSATPTVYEPQVVTVVSPALQSLVPAESAQSLSP